MLTSATQNRTILLVEDDKGIRYTLQLALELEGYTVFTANNGKEGIAALSEIPRPFIILLDLMMPEMDGWGFLKVLEQDTRLGTIPVIVLTAFNNDPKAIRAKEIIEKPVDLDHLFKTMRLYCESAVI
jgi:CheY-like chemotaxis protein